MISLPRGSRLVIASHNKGKLREIQDLVSPFGLDAVGAGALGLPEPEETAMTFAGNARLKSEGAARASGLPSLSDDSGLCVAALDGAPGIYSARWAGETKDFRLAMRRVEQELKRTGKTDKRAYFVSVLALAAPGEETEIFEGRVFGMLTFPPRGSKGFGYDPIFVPEGGRLTFGEMEPAAKHAISHRARAFEKFARAVFFPVSGS